MSLGQFGCFSSKPIFKVGEGIQFWWRIHDGVEIALYYYPDSGKVRAGGTTDKNGKRYPCVLLSNPLYDYLKKVCKERFTCPAVTAEI